MNEVHSVAPGSIAESDGRAVNLLDMMIGLAKHKKLLVLLPIAAALLAGGISLFLPNVYRASAVLLPPQQPQSGASALLAQLGGAAGAAAGVAGIKNPNDLYIGMLKSRTVADRVIAKFDLKKAYGIDSQEKARKRLALNTAISAGKDNLISIDVEDEDQQLVAKLSNAYTSELLRLTSDMAVTEAAQRRMFYERQLEMAKNNLAKAEMALKGAIETRGVISVDGESRGVVETIAKLRALVSAKVIELDSMQAFVTPNHPSHKLVAEEISSLRSELAKLENGTGQGTASLGGAAVAQSGFENIQRLRDLKYYQMLYELLSKQYEAARLDEAKDPSVIQVLDAAVAPERHVRPKRLLLAIVGGVAGLFIAFFWAFLAETRKAAMQRPGAAAKWNEFRTLIRKKSAR